MSNHRRMTSQFVEQAQKVHGDRFDYSEVEYVNTHKPVRIKCRQCGVVFMQEPASHLAGHGCPNCGKQQLKRRMSQEVFIENAGRYMETDTTIVGRNIGICAQRS